ncbi:heme biosynthesis HemY N-terminal domain-containing protein [Crenobacter cavernae]|uniref:Heme biosynthesis protein HemY n=1 Tax=Crenobacter cavernae TaxID=2290923 RepID=A0ABY0FH47_9NEIS|nr:heme biosynthesis HemY N-terminal domain-containing protein [Crenobacter cavernae]RXZ44394.1 heme biosynthesis protein HemY [Crenobacter cavernae]
MKFVLWIVGLFALAVLLGLASTVNNGYAILFLPPYRMEVSFNLLIVGVIVLILLTHGALRLIGAAASLPAEVRRFQRQKKLKAARHALREAGIAFFEGRYQKAEREAAHSIEDEYSPENKALALLIAARAAGATGDTAKRDAYLTQLDALPERLRLARHMLEAELKLSAKDPLEALAAVERARALSPNLTSALRLELKIRLMQKQPDAVLALTEKLLKADALEPEQARRYRIAAYNQQLAGFTSGAEVARWLKKVPDVERANPDLMQAVIDRLLLLGDDAQAAQLLSASFDKGEASPELSRRLGQLAERLPAATRVELLSRAEKWLAASPDDHWLLVALGRLAFAEQLWGKAQSYLEASLSLQTTLAAHAELARLFEATDKPELAERHYRQSVELALSDEN